LLLDERGCLEECAKRVRAGGPETTRIAERNSSRLEALPALGGIDQTNILRCTDDRLMLWA